MKYINSGLMTVLSHPEIRGSGSPPFLNESTNNMVGNCGVEQQFSKICGFKREFFFETKKFLASCVAGTERNACCFSLFFFAILYIKRPLRFLHTSGTIRLLLTSGNNYGRLLALTFTLRHGSKPEKEKLID